MKNLIILALSLLGYNSFAQSTQLGVETGTIAYYNLEYFSGGKSVKSHKHWKQADFANGIFIRHETKSHWAYQLSANYYRDKHSEIIPLGFGTVNVEHYKAALSQDIFNYSASLQYRLNSNQAMAKHRNKLISFIGLSYTRLHADCSYEFYMEDAPPTFYPPTHVKTKWDDDLFGLNYWGKYTLNKHLALSLDLSYKISSRYSSQSYPYNNDAVFTKFTTKIGDYYTYTKPTTYLTCMLGICYSFNK